VASGRRAYPPEPRFNASAPGAADGAAGPLREVEPGAANAASQLGREAGGLASRGSRSAERE